MRIAAIFALLVFTGTSASAASAPLTAPKDLQRATGEQFRWSVYLPGNFSECGGVVVKKGWILTAAHCVHKLKKKGENVMVDLRNPDGTSNPRSITVSPHNIWIASGYAEANENDIALMRVDEPDKIPDDAAIELASADEALPKSAYVGVWRTILISNPQTGAPVPVLASVYKPTAVLSANKCQGAGFICAGSPSETRLERGDSGNGLTTLTHGCAKLVGIAHFVATSDRYVRVSKHLSWIESIMGKQTIKKKSIFDCKVS
jgi:secreted trypsin-like serine protease